MHRESQKAKRARAIQIAQALQGYYPHADTELVYDNDPFHLTIAVLLSAQTTDKAVNKVTPVLWSRYPTIEALAAAKLADVEEIIRPIGFYHTKAQHVIACAQMVLTDFHGQVPQSMEELQRLPGVGRKTANVISNTAFGKVYGIAVDTHVFRITHLLGLSNAATPAQTEQDLMKLLPRPYWTPLNHELVLFGREICIARRPKCGVCPLAAYCPSAAGTGDAAKSASASTPVQAAQD